MRLPLLDNGNKVCLVTVILWAVFACTVSERTRQLFTRPCIAGVGYLCYHNRHGIACVSIFKQRAKKDEPSAEKMAACGDDGGER